jgi:hypothetical protein
MGPESGLWNIARTTKTDDCGTLIGRESSPQETREESRTVGRKTASLDRIPRLGKVYATEHRMHIGKFTLACRKG